MPRDKLPTSTGDRRISSNCMNVKLDQGNKKSKQLLKTADPDFSTTFFLHASFSQKVSWGWKWKKQILQPPPIYIYKYIYCIYKYIHSYRKWMLFRIQETRKNTNKFMCQHAWVIFWTYLMGSLRICHLNATPLHHHHPSNKAFLREYYMKPTIILHTRPP